MLLLWVGFWLNAAAAAQTAPTCVTKTSSTTYQEPADLKALLRCQKKKLARCAAEYETQHEDLPPDATMQRWRRLQDGEARDFIRRHPGRSVPAEAADSAAPAAQSQAQNLDALRQDLLEKSDQGRKGITPEMAADIVDMLIKQQGSVSPDMTDLLNAVQKDGPNLSGDTFLRLQEAARKADASGLDLGVPPDIKDSLLKGQPAPTPASPGVD